MFLVRWTSHGVILDDSTYQIWLGGTEDRMILLGVIMNNLLQYILRRNLMINMTALLYRLVYINYAVRTQQTYPHLKSFRRSHFG